MANQPPNKSKRFLTRNQNYTNSSPFQNSLKNSSHTIQNYWIISQVILGSFLKQFATSQLRHSIRTPMIGSINCRFRSLRWSKLRLPAFWMAFLNKEKTKKCSILTFSSPSWIRTKFFPYLLDISLEPTFACSTIGIRKQSIEFTANPKFFIILSIIPSIWQFLTQFSSFWIWT